MDKDHLALGTGFASIVLQVNLIECLIRAGLLERDAMKEMVRETMRQIQAIKVDQWHTDDVVAVANLRLSQALLMLG